MARKTTTDNTCNRCKGLCCKYMALEIDEPETAGDFDDIRWYIAHERVSVFVEDDDWFVQFKSRCRHLMKNNRCDIYERRPKICRGYGTGSCELTGEGDAHDLTFTRPEQIEAYAKDYLRAKRRKTSKAGRKRKAR